MVVVEKRRLDMNLQEEALLYLLEKADTDEADRLWERLRKEIGQQKELQRGLEELRRTVLPTTTRIRHITYHGSR